MKHLLLSGAARLVGLLPQGVATLLASWLILNHFGVHAFNTYALVISMMAMIPLNNLGVGASITQAIAAHGVQDERSTRAALTASRVLAISGLGLAVASSALGAMGMWPVLLGDASGANWFTAVALVVYAATFVPGLASSVLLGVNRNHVSIVVGSFLAPVSLLVVLVLIVGDLDGRLIVVVPPLALLVINLVTMAVSTKLEGFPWGRIVRQVPQRTRYPGARIRSLSGPMLVTSLCVPVAFASDRIVLSHVSTEAAVANYSVVLQLCAPILGLIVAAAQPLWPLYTKARSQGESGPDLTKVFLAFGGGTVVCSAALVLLADPIGHLIGGDEINLGYFLPLMAALVLCLIAIAYPLSMSLVDPAGARFVAFCAVLTVPTNLGLSIWLARDLGAPGPLISLLIVSTVVQIVPISIYARRRVRSGKPIMLLDPEDPELTQSSGTKR